MSRYDVIPGTRRRFDVIVSHAGFAGHANDDVFALPSGGRVRSAPGRTGHNMAPVRGPSDA
jgi:hypothetical protein